MTIVTIILMITTILSIASALTFLDRRRKVRENDRIVKEIIEKMERYEQQRNQNK